MFTKGTILHGKNTRIGNLWIITYDQSFEGSLLWDGKYKAIIHDIAYKRDKMAPDMTIATMDEVRGIIGGHNNLPIWAVNLMGSPAAQLPLLPFVINPTVYKTVMKVLDKDKPMVMKKVDNPDDRCDHEYKSYQGLTECYDFCVKCDKKVRHVQ
jgi:hypothetical protein